MRSRDRLGANLRRKKRKLNEQRVRCRVFTAWTTESQSTRGRLTKPSTTAADEHWRKRMIDKARYVQGSWVRTVHGQPCTSRSELLVLLGHLQRQLNGFFEEVRGLPQLTAQRKARDQKFTSCE